MSHVSSEDFEAFVAARTGALLRYAYVLTGDRHRAEDLVQSALANCYRHWRRVDDVGAEAYVRRAVLNAHLSWWRRPYRRHETDVEDFTAVQELTGQAAAADSGLDARDEMWRALATLPPRQRAVIVLRYYEDLTEQETAAALGVALGTVKSQTAKAMRRLRADLAESPAPETAESSGGLR